MGFLRPRERPASAGDGRDGGRADQDRVEVGCATDVGGRSENQDRVAISTSWAIVSDGVGGQAGGSLAAELTVAQAVATFDAAVDGFDEETMTEAVRRANEAVRSARLEDRAVANMGATLTMAAAVSVSPDGSTWLLANIGDSPAWLVTADGATQLTEDHTLTAALVRSGALTSVEAASHPQRHVILRAVGVEESAEADVRTVDLRPGQYLVLATDGLSDVLDAAGIGEVVAAGMSADTAAQRLVAAALDHDTSDNVTVAVVRHLPSFSDDRPSSDDRRSP